MSIRVTYSSVLGLWDEDVDDGSLDSTPAAEDNVGSPRDTLKSDRDTELVGKKTNSGEQVGESHSLGAHLEGQDLDWVESLHWRPSKRVENLEEVDPCEDGLGDGWLDAVLVLLGRVVGDVGDGVGDGDGDPAERADDVDDDEHWATTEFVDHGGTSTSEDNLHGIHAHLDVDLLGGSDDTGGLEEGRQEVRHDTVAGPLSKERDDASAEKTIARCSIAEESTVIPPSLVSPVHLQVRLVLRHL